MTLVILASLTVSETRAQSSAGSSAIGALTGSSLSDEAGQAGTASEDSARARAAEPTEAAAAKPRAKLARAHFDKGMQYRKSGDSSRALIEFLKATREDPKQLDAYYEQALIFREKGFHKLAVSRLEQALAIKPKYQKARLLLATVKLEQGNVSDAVEQLGESLGLPKAASTALKPDEEPDNEERVAGIPPMILQSLHPAMTPPAVPEQEGARISENSSEPQDDAVAQEKRAISESRRPARRRRPANRKKLRELIARKYKSNDSKVQQRKNWIAKLFSWPDTFKAGAPADHRLATADDDEDDDLQTRAESNLKEEFRKNDKTASDDEPTPSRRTKKTLLAYNGDPADTLDLVYGKPSRTDAGIVEHDSDRDSEKTSEAPVSDRSAEREAVTNSGHSSLRMSEQDTQQPAARASESNAAARDSQAIPARSPVRSPQAVKATPRKIASRGWADLDDDTSHPNAPEQKTKAAAKPPAKPMPAIVEDHWTKRLRYLAENGTSSLTNGEAFMFSEDTGEAVLFLKDGQRIRRVIAAQLDSQEVLKMRRPDVLVPKELFYNTSLLGKVVNSPPPPAPPPPTVPQMEIPAKTSPSSAPTPPSFKIEQIMDNPTGFWNWCKRGLNL